MTELEGMSENLKEVIITVAICLIILFCTLLYYTVLRWYKQCPGCKKMNFVKDRISLLKHSVDTTMTHGRRTKRGRTDKRYNTRYVTVESFIYATICQHCGMSLNFTTASSLPIQKYLIGGNEYKHKGKNWIYFLNTFVFALIGGGIIYYLLLNLDYQFKLVNLFLTGGIIFLSFILNLAAYNIHFSRYFILFLLFVQASGIYYFERKKIKYENELKDDFKAFKNQHYLVWDGNDSIIIVESTGREIKRFYLPKGKKYSGYDKYIFQDGKWEGLGELKKKTSEDRIYLNIDEQSLKSAIEEGRGLEKATVSRQDRGIHYDVVVRDISFDANENRIEVKYMGNSIEEYERKITSTRYIQKSNFEKVKNGAKSILN